MNNLRRQVISEVKKKRLIFMTFAALTFIYLGIVSIFGDSGLLKFIELKNKKLRLEEEIKEIELTNRSLKEEIQLLKENPFYMEKVAREELKMAKPDEYIFLYER